MKDMQGRQSGFTLIEVIAVLLVLAILAGLVGVRLRPGGGSDALQATAHDSPRAAAPQGPPPFAAAPTRPSSSISPTG